MAEVVKCPNCNAQLHIIPNVIVLKCEYCDTEIIINNNIQNFPQQMNGFPQQVNGFPQQMNGFPQQANGFPQQINNYVNTGNYVEDTKKWKKTFRKHLIIQALLTAFFTVLIESDASGIDIITFLIAAVYSFVIPFRLSKNKPLLPTPQKNNKLLDFIKIYSTFAEAFWGGMILMEIIFNL